MIHHIINFPQLSRGNHFDLDILRIHGEIQHFSWISISSGTGFQKMLVFVLIGFFLLQYRLSGNNEAYQMARSIFL